MMQKHVPHPAGTFSPCAQCQREPKHIVSSGRSSAEPIDFRRGGTGDRHSLECCPCGRSTARHASLPAAVAEWGVAYAQASLPLRFSRPRRRAAA